MKSFGIHARGSLIQVLALLLLRGNEAEVYELDTRLDIELSRGRQKVVIVRSCVECCIEGNIECKGSSSWMFPTRVLPSKNVILLQLHFVRECRNRNPLLHCLVILPIFSEVASAG